MVLLQLGGLLVHGWRRLGLGGTTFTFRLYAKESETEEAKAAVESAMKRMKELEAIFSDYDGDSEVLRFCHQPPGTRVKLSAPLHEILIKSQKLANETDGAFDVTIGTLTHLWRRSRRDMELPSEEHLKRAFAGVGHQHLQLHDDQTGEIAIDHMRINLGGIAKGYGADEALKMLRKAGFPRALVAASGDIAFGDPPPNEKGWRLGLTSLESPEEPDRYILLANAACSTSGDTKQFLPIDGKRYSHIVDPKTGLGLTHRRSVSVVAKNAVTTDSVATALSIMPADQHQQLLKLYDGAARVVDETTGETVLGEFPDFIEP
ncbi:MAG: FAD:protein FMN transferase [Verrucomicrobiota bacterium]